MRRALAVVAVVAVLAGAWTLVQRQRDRQLTTQNATVLESVKRVMKLTTVEMTISDWRLRKDSKRLFGFIPVQCEKTLAVFYRGKVAAGFDMTASASTSLAVTTHPTERRVRVHLPAARLLYTDVPAPELLVTDGSLCNRVDAQDYVELHVEARKAVEEQALAQGILARAEAQARDLLTEILRPLGYTLELTMDPSPLFSASTDAP